MTGAPPEGYRLRAATLEDAAAIADLMDEVNLAEVGTPFASVEGVRDDLAVPEGDAWRESLVLVDRDGAIGGFLQVWSVAPPFTEIQTWAFVRPGLWGRGLSASLLREGERRARARIDLAPRGTRVRLSVPRWATNAAAARLFASLGFEYARTFWTMRIELDERVAAPAVPAGIRFRTFERGRDERSVHATLSEAFEDHWGRGLAAFDLWRHEELEGEGSGFDPGLWYLATDGEEVAGVLIGREATPEAPGTGEVSELGVRRAWRGRGIGLALLLTAFSELRRRGVGAAQLRVDAESLTGATRLYERAGMRVVQRSEHWMKELRPAG